MPTSFLEIVELPNGDFALRRIDDDRSPLVKITFSREAKELLQHNDLDVAKAMITAGIEAVGAITHELEIEEEDDEEEGDQDIRPHTLH